MSDVIETAITRAEAAIRSAGMVLPSGDVVEQRRISVSSIEARDVNEDGSWKFRGHAAVFDSNSEELGVFFPFVERIQRGAFKHALSDDVRFLLNHEGVPLARNGVTMQLSEDPRGLLVEADIAPTQAGNDLRISLERGDVDQMSFMFTIDTYEWDESVDPPIRTITRIGKLYDVSVVTFPAYPETDAGVRSDDPMEGRSRDEVMDLAWKIHRGELDAVPDVRTEIERALHNFSTVSPWEAERSLVAVASEPELLAAVPDKRVSVEMTPLEGDGPAFRLAAAQRRLKAREQLLAA